MYRRYFCGRNPQKMKGCTLARLNYLCLILIVLLLAVACSKAGKPAPIPPGPEIPEVPNVPNDAEKTPVGTPVGVAAQQEIGATGGTFTAFDGRITLEFPAGALNPLHPSPFNPLPTTVQAVPAM